jgi:filamin
VGKVRVSNGQWVNNYNYYNFIICRKYIDFVVDGEDQKKAHLSVGASSEVSLKVTEADISNLTASIRSPSGLEEPCVLKRLANGHLG